MLVTVDKEPRAAAESDNAIPEGFIPLFNGINLEGWTARQPENRDWQVVGGVIDCERLSYSSVAFSSRNYVNQPVSK
jgi:hypothetical protein